MTVKELISKKDYLWVGFRLTHPDIPGGIFAGACKSVNGELIPLDGDCYDENEEVMEYGEFKCEEYDNAVCLDITIKTEWRGLDD